MVKNRDLSVEDFSSLEELKLDVPKLILGISLSAKDGVYGRNLKFKPGYTGYNIVHEINGRHRTQKFILGTVIEPRDNKIEKAIRKIEESYYGKGDCITLTDIINYKNDLNNLLKVDCNECWRDFYEGCYPINLQDVYTLSNIKAKTISELVEWNTGWERAAYADKWKLFILGRNKS